MPRESNDLQVDWRLGDSERISRRNAAKPISFSVTPWHLMTGYESSMLLDWTSAGRLRLPSAHLFPSELMEALQVAHREVAKLS